MSAVARPLASSSASPDERGWESEGVKDSLWFDCDAELGGR